MPSSLLDLVRVPRQLIQVPHHSCNRALLGNISGKMRSLTDRGQTVDKPMDRPWNGLKKPWNGLKKPWTGIPPKRIVLRSSSGHNIITWSSVVALLLWFGAMSQSAAAFLKKAKHNPKVQALERSLTVESDGFLFGRDNHDADDFDRREINKCRTPTCVP